MPDIHLVPFTVTSSCAICLPQNLSNLTDLPLKEEVRNGVLPIDIVCLHVNSVQIKCTGNS